jgi:hypothetical protein
MAALAIAIAVRWLTRDRRLEAVAPDDVAVASESQPSGRLHAPEEDVSPDVALKLALKRLAQPDPPVGLALTVETPKEIGSIVWGTVVDPADAPLAEAHVSFTDRMGERIHSTTDSEGHYSVSGHAHRPMVRRGQRRRLLVQREWMQFDDRAPRVQRDFQLERSVRLLVRVLTPDGGPFCEVDQERAGQGVIPLDPHRDARSRQRHAFLTQSRELAATLRRRAWEQLSPRAHPERSPSSRCSSPLSARQPAALPRSARHTGREPWQERSRVRARRRRDARAPRRARLDRSSIRRSVRHSRRPASSSGRVPGVMQPGRRSRSGVPTAECPARSLRLLRPGSKATRPSACGSSSSGIQGRTDDRLASRVRNPRSTSSTRWASHFARDPGRARASPGELDGQLRSSVPRRAAQRQE